MLIKHMLRFKNRVVTFVLFICRLTVCQLDEQLWLHPSRHTGGAGDGGSSRAQCQPQVGRVGVIMCHVVWWCSSANDVPAGWWRHLVVIPAWPYWSHSSSCWWQCTKLTHNQSWITSFMVQYFNYASIQNLSNVKIIQLNVSQCMLHLEKFNIGSSPKREFTYRLPKILI